MGLLRSGIRVGGIGRGVGEGGKWGGGGVMVVDFLMLFLPV